MGKRSTYKKPGKIDLSQEYLERKANALHNAGWPISKWIVFSLTLIMHGYKLKLHEATNTNSKYLYVFKGEGKPTKVRYSDHKANHDTEMAGECDFYVGVGNFGVKTTEDVLGAIFARYNESDDGVRYEFVPQEEE